MLKQLSFFFSIITFFSFFSVYGQDRVNGKSFATRSMVIAQHGMVCTSQPLASIAGLDILKDGGTAIDAVIAANAALGVAGSWLLILIISLKTFLTVYEGNFLKD